MSEPEYVTHVHAKNRVADCPLFWKWEAQILAENRRFSEEMQETADSAETSPYHVDSFLQGLPNKEGSWGMSLLGRFQISLLRPLTYCISLCEPLVWLEFPACVPGQGSKIYCYAWNPSNTTKKTGDRDPTGKTGDRGDRTES